MLKIKTTKWHRKNRGNSYGRLVSVFDIIITSQHLKDSGRGAALSSKPAWLWCDLISTNKYMIILLIISFPSFLFKSLLRSPEVVQFLQKQQQLLNQQVLEQRQQQFPGAPVWVAHKLCDFSYCNGWMEFYAKGDILIVRHWWCTPGIPVLGRLSQEDPKFEPACAT